MAEAPGQAVTPTTTTPQPEEDFFDTLPDAQGAPAPEQESDFFNALPDAEPTTGEKAGAVARGAAGGALETGGFVAGAGTGMALGSAAGPVGTFVGGLVGGTAGFLAGREAREATVGTLAGEEEALRPFATGGETFGAGVPFIGAPIAIGKAGLRMAPTLVGRFVNRIFDSASRSPISFARTEASALGYAAVAGGAAEAFRPGETLTRVGAEVAAGMLNPARLIHHTAQGAWHAGTRVWNSLTSAGRQTQAGKLLKELVEEAGEDPEQLAALLRETMPEGFKQVTAAQKTGSPALAALEGKLARESVRFGNDARRMAEDGLEAIHGLTRMLRGTGSPEALRQAAQLREKHFRALVEGRLKLVEHQAQDAARRITADTPAARAQLGRQARAAADEALSEARAVERELWQRIPRDLDMKAQSILQRHTAIREELLPEERLPEVVEGFVGRLTEGQGATTSGELLRFRSRALALAREADGQGNFNDARVFGQLAEAALDDLSGIGGTPGSALDEARAFSRVLNDTFTRSFVGRAQATARTGAPRIPPEVMMRRAFASGREVGDLQMRELSEATQFLSRQGINSPAAAENIGLMWDAQERILRLAASDAVDPNTGRASASRLGKFVRDNDALLQRFPEVRDDLQRAVDSETQRENIARIWQKRARVVEQRAAFSRALEVENPVDAVTQALRGRRPVGDIRNLMTTARRAGPDAVEGMKAAIFDHALRQSGDDFSPERVRSALFDPLGPNQKSLVDVMTSTGMVGQDDVKNLRRMLGAADNIVSGLRGEQQFEALAENPDAFMDLLASYIGVQGPMVRMVEGPGQLVVAGRAASFTRRLFSNMPQARVRDTLIEAARNPEFAAMLLTKPETQEESLQLARHIHAYLIQGGFDLAPESEAGPEVRTE